MNKIIKRIDELKNIINRANYEYHTLDKPTLTDYEYDMFLKELIELETKFPKLKTDDSPTNKVGGVVLSELKKIRHSEPMMSLSNVFNYDELRSFYEKLNNDYPNLDVVSELKIDGLAINLKYENGKFIQASTRGDGIIGEDVTENAKTIKTLPLKLKKDVSLTVRGEVFMNEKEFIKINKKRYEDNLPLFANPRNIAAGSMRQLDSKITATRNLDIFIYTIVNPENYNIKTQAEALKYIKALGFNINPHYKLVNNIDDLIKEINYYEKLRTKLNYPTDGVVIKVNQFNLYNKIGYTSKEPKWATAFKFKPEIKETKLNSITFQVGRTGVITPVANLEPVNISGSIVSRATLHNEDYILEKDIRVGDYVYINKAGEIIPQVLKVNLDKRTNQQKFKMIDTCPICGEKLIKNLDFADHFCQNENCPSRIVQKLIYFASKQAMDIESLGEKAIINLHEKGFIKNIEDIYNLKDHYNELINLPGYGKKSVDKILNSIEESKNKPFSNLLASLGINEVGKKTAKILTSYFKTIDNLINANYEELETIENIGPVIANNIINFFKIKQNISLINFFKENNFNLKENEIKKDLKLNNMTFVITGTLTNLLRDEAQLLIESLGGKTTSNVSKKTSYLLVGSNPGSKYKKAKDLNIPILTEKDFMELIK